MKKNDYQTISISIDHNRVKLFFYFLEKGVKKEIDVGCDIRTLLKGQFGMTEDYIDNRLKTIFFNYNAVDDANSTFVEEGSILALSAAMPGLAGATFRRSEHLKPSSETLERKKKFETGVRRKGLITIKLFNLILKELGPSFLASGVFIPMKDFKAFLLKQENEFAGALGDIAINGRPASFEALSALDFKDDSELIQLSIISD